MEEVLRHTEEGPQQEPPTLSLPGLDGNLETLISYRWLSEECSRDENNSKKQESLMETLEPVEQTPKGGTPYLSHHGGLWDSKNQSPPRK